MVVINVENPNTLNLKVGLIGLGDKMPNLALMKISAYHKALGDTVCLDAGGDITYISCCFSKYRNYAEHALNVYHNAVLGGPGWDHKTFLPPEINNCQPDYTLYGLRGIDQKMKSTYCQESSISKKQVLNQTVSGFISYVVITPLGKKIGTVLLYFGILERNLLLCSMREAALN